MQQNFEIRVIDEFILLGNSVVVKCLLPSFVADFIQVISWLVIDNEESTEISSASKNIGKSHQQLDNSTESLKSFQLNFIGSSGNYFIYLCLPHHQQFKPIFIYSLNLISCEAIFRSSSLRRFRDAWKCSHFQMSNTILRRRSCGSNRMDQHRERHL